MTRSKILLGFFLMVFLFPSSAFTQDLPKATKYPNAKWYLVVYFKFKADKVDDGLNLIYDQFIPADKASGRQSINFDYVVGPWHHVVYFPLEEGPAELQWKISPTDEKWWSSLAKIAGGSQKAHELLKKWADILVDERTEIVLRRM